MELDIEAKLMDVYDSSNLNRVEEYEAIAVSYAHGQRYSSNTVQLVDRFEKWGGGGGYGCT